MSKLPRIVALQRFPVKGLSPEPLESVDLTIGDPIPGDRAYAVENGPSGFDPRHPAFLPKMKFLMLMRNAKLAGLRTQFDDASQMLTISDADGTVLAEGCLDLAAGRAAIEGFLAEFMGPEMRGPARVLSAVDHHFFDVSARVLSLVNLATVREFSRMIGVELDPLRFRANIHIDGLKPWSELDWAGRSLIGGAARFSVKKPIERCAATDVNPETAARDTKIPATLLRERGVNALGIYLLVTGSGRIAVGDAIFPLT